MNPVSALVLRDEVLVSFAHPAFIWPLPTVPPPREKVAETLWCQELCPRPNPEFPAAHPGSSLLQLLPVGSGMRTSSPQGSSPVLGAIVPCTELAAGGSEQGQSSAGCCPADFPTACSWQPSAGPAPHPAPLTLAGQQVSTAALLHAGGAGEGCFDCPKVSLGRGGLLKATPAGVGGRSLVE